MRRLVYIFLITTAAFQINGIFGYMLKNEATNVDQDKVPLQEGQKSDFTGTQMLRILIDYQPSFNALPDVQYYKDNVMTPAVNYLQSALSPKNPSPSPILVNQDCQGEFNFQNNNPNLRACSTNCQATTTCANQTIPALYLKKCLKSSGDTYVSTGTDGAGAPNTDIVILAVSYYCSGTMLAQALSCFQEPTLDRPVLGVIILCQQQYFPRFNIQMNINTIKHEIIHALGFNSDKFAYFRDQNGLSLTARDAAGVPNLGFNSVGSFYTFSPKVGKLVTRNRKSLLVPGGYTKQVYTLILPTLLSMAQTYFNCPTLDGVDLQDSSPVGTINSHFHKLFVNNELMSPTSDVGEGLTSFLTLAFLQDTGWYTADFTMAENYTYGKGLGCDFLLNGCYDYIQKQTANQLSPFCNIVPRGYVMQCSDDRRYTYTCHIYKTPGIDPKNVYFNTVINLPAGDAANTYAGDSAYNEYCPVNVKDQYNTSTSDCNVGTNSLRTDIDYVQWNEYYGSDSKCFDTTATAWAINSPTANYNPGVYGAHCFQYKCDQITLTLYVYNSGQIVCQTTTQSVVNNFKMNYLTASINCPTYANVCVTPATQVTTQIKRFAANVLQPNIFWILIICITLIIRF